MFNFFMKLYYFTGIPLFTSNSVGFLLKSDEWGHKEIMNYIAVQMSQVKVLPNASNRIPESILWQLRQPAYMVDTPQYSPATFLPWAAGGYKNRRIVEWDGTFNMPLDRLADPTHKDARMVNFI